MKNMMKNKRAAMEMSVGTMVTIVLLMIVLVLGIFFIQKIFGAGTNAIDQIDTEMQNQIQKLFGADDDKQVAMYPTSQRITINQGDRDKGFGFFVRNLDSTTSSFTFDIMATDTSACPASLTEEIATGYLLGESGEINGLASGDTYQRLVTFIIPETAPLCTINYDLVVKRDNGNNYGGLNFALTIK